MPILLEKVQLKLLRNLGFSSLKKIKRGLLKGAKWNVSIPDSRYITGTYEEDLGNRVKSAVEKGMRLVDIGANAGYFTLIADKHGADNLQHIAVEPFPANVRLLKQHLEANNAAQVIVEEIAISDRVGEIKFSNSSNLAANTYKTESSIFSQDQISVPTIDLDTLAKKHNLDHNCCLKIDVEGAELDVLKGGKEYLSTNHPAIFLATHDCHVENVMDDCLKFLYDLGYKTEQIDDDKVVEGQADFYCYYDN